MGIRYEDRFDHFGNMPEQTLFDIARNPSALWEYRKTAVEILLYKNSAKAYHRELSQLLLEVSALPETVVHESEPVENQPIEVETAPETGPLVASVTTATMFADEFVQKTDTEVALPAEEAPINDTQLNTKEISL